MAVSPTPLKYPILLLHGVGFRDNWTMDYWGRVPARLQQEGAVVRTAGQDAWAPLAHNTALAQKALLSLLQETGASKVHIIAHSKGGLEARYLVERMGMSPFIASITTLCTPHQGSRAADLYGLLPRPLRRLATWPLNHIYAFLGDSCPEMDTSLEEVSTKACRQRNLWWVRNHPTFPCISYGARLHNPLYAPVYLLTWPLIRLLEGENDGLVSVSSAAGWGEYRGTLHSRSGGVSHQDACDLSRRRFPDGCIPSLYRKILRDLRAIEAAEPLPPSGQCPAPPALR